MRVAWMGVTIVLMPVAAMAGTDIVATCYQTWADSTHSNPEYKACVARRGQGRSTPERQL
jgi:hypothetical protein